MNGEDKRADQRNGMRAHQPTKQQKDKRAIQRMKQNIDRVISDWIVPAGQIIDRKRKRHQRPVAATAGIVAGGKNSGPVGALLRVGMLENQLIVIGNKTVRQSV